MKKFGPPRHSCAIVLCCMMMALAANAQTFLTLSTFNENNGAVPSNSLVQGTDGNLYGTTQSGGRAESGTVFRMTTAGALSLLYSFCSQTNCVDGGLPMGGLVQGTDGNFYGTTSIGGASGQGTVFKITSSGSLTTLHSFCALANCADGQSPHAGLVQGKDGNFYGTTIGSYPAGGNLFRITPSGTLTTLYTFCSLANCSDGLAPEGGLIQATDRNLYGTTSQGGAFGTGGTIFRLDTSGNFTTLYSFCSLLSCADGSTPYAGLVQGKDGNLYGTTSAGGSPGKGTAFMLTTSGQLTTLYNFCSQASCADGEYPYAGVVQGTDGNFYGATEAGGSRSNNTICPFGCGTLFQLTPTGVLSTVYNLCTIISCTDGAQPFASLVQASSGTFYGTTSYGGSCTTRLEGCGTIFSWSSNVALPPTFTPTSVTFGNQPVNISKQRSVTLKNINTGYAILNVSNATITGNSDFVISSNGCTAPLAAGKLCNIYVTFTPTSLTAESATLNVFDNVPGSPQTVPMTGTGVPQASLMPSSLTYPRTKVGNTSAPKNVNLRNNLPTTLTGITFSTTGPFAVSSKTCGTTLASGSTCSFSIVFKPTVTGPASGTFTVRDSANNSPQSTSLSGNGG